MITSLIGLMALLWVDAIFIGQQVMTAETPDSKVIVPVPFGEDCHPAIMIRKASEASDDIEYDCR